MAAGIYRFTFTATANSDITIDYSTDGGQTFQPVQGNNKLQLNSGDSFAVALRGPAGWSMPGDLQVIVSRGNNANSGQNYSPFANGSVWFEVQNVSGTWSASNNLSTWTSAQMGGGIQAGNGNKKYEVTIAFPASMTGLATQFFAIDPEMDIGT